MAKIERDSGPGVRTFNRRRILAAIARAGAIGKPDAGFLGDIAGAEIAFRLSATNRAFGRALDLFSTGPELVGAMRASFPGLEIEQYTFAEWLAGAKIGKSMDEASRDLVISLFGLHRMADPLAVMGIVRRALRPDGLFLGVLPGEGTLAELGEAMMSAELASGGGAGLRIEPFVSLAQVGDWLRQAGFALPVADVERMTLRYANLADLVADLRAMAAVNCLTGGRAPLSRSAYAAIEAEYRRRSADPDGKLRVTVNLIYLSGWAPAENQQRPLRPGSAKQRLADALRAAENPPGTERR
jgi:SAM-dependent methyltransferase